MACDSLAPHPPLRAAWGAPSRVTRWQLFDKAILNFELWFYLFPFAF